MYNVFECDDVVAHGKARRSSLAKHPASFAMRPVAAELYN
jgi:hypothetical protein